MDQKEKLVINIGVADHTENGLEFICSWEENGMPLDSLGVAIEVDDMCSYGSKYLSDVLKCVLQIEKLDLWDIKLNFFNEYVGKEVSTIYKKLRKAEDLGQDLLASLVGQYRW